MNKIESIHICVAGKKYNISQFLCIQIPPKYVRRLCFGARRKSVEKCTANNTPSASWSCKKKWPVTEFHGIQLAPRHNQSQIITTFWKSGRCPIFGSKNGSKFKPSNPMVLIHQRSPVGLATEGSAKNQIFVGGFLLHRKLPSIQALRHPWNRAFGHLPRLTEKTTLVHVQNPVAKTQKMSSALLITIYVYISVYIYICFFYLHLCIYLFWHISTHIYIYTIQTHDVNIHINTYYICRNLN